MVLMGLSNVLGEIGSSHRSPPAAQRLLGPSRVYEPPPDLSSNADLYKEENIQVLLLRTLDKCKVILCGASVCFLLFSPSAHSPLSLSHPPLLPFALTFHLICGFALTIYSIRPSFIPKLITSLTHFFIFCQPPSHVVFSCSPPVLALPHHLLMFCCVSCSSGVDERRRWYWKNAPKYSACSETSWRVD